jgi:hypothetical protein
MKISRTLILLLAAMSSAAFTASDASAQVRLGVHGTLADVRDVAAGIGGRIAFMRASGGTNLGLEAAGTYYFPSCSGFDCDAWGGHIVIIGKRPLGGQAHTYAGIGAKYVDVTGRSGDQSSSGDAWGMIVLFGSEYAPNSPVMPFFEFGWSFMDSFPDIWEITLGLKVTLGGQN